MNAPRYPFADLERLIPICEQPCVGQESGSHRHTARRLGITDEAVRQWRARGVDERTAERFAIAIGLMPENVWPEWDVWLIDCEACGEPFSPITGEGYVSDRQRFCSKRCKWRAAKQRRKTSAA